MVSSPFRLSRTTLTRFGIEALGWAGDRERAPRCLDGSGSVVEPGTALVVTRYAEEKAVVLSPADFDRLAALDAALEEIEAGERLLVSELARTAHSLEDEPGSPLEDPDALEALGS
jgi:PHD/YefM family antitoxin component YafN of YafNO toxin-antitoxin module